MGVIPLCVSCSAGDTTPTVGVEPYVGSGSASGGAGSSGAPTVGIIPAFGSGSTSGSAGSGDAPSVGILPYLGSGSASGGADASSDTAPTIGIEPAYILDAGGDTSMQDANGDGASSATPDATGD